MKKGKKSKGGKGKKKKKGSKKKATKEFLPSMHDIPTFEDPKI